MPLQHLPLRFSPGLPAQVLKPQPGRRQRCGSQGVKAERREANSKYIQARRIHSEARQLKTVVMLSSGVVYKDLFLVRGS